MKSLAQNNLLYIVGVAFAIINVYYVYRGELVVCLIPIALLFIYCAFFHLDQLFLFVALVAPLSVNIEEFVNYQWGLFIPTEPVLFGVLLLVIFQQVRRNVFPIEFLRHPVTVLMVLQLVWVFVSAFTSEFPAVSFKYLLMKSWFIIPVYFFGYLLFRDSKNVSRFIWLYLLGLTAVILYTLTNHAANGFDEESGHWVMWPFFKDHTSYGAIAALFFPILFGWMWTESKFGALRVILVVLTVLFAVAVLLSYTRAAWLSIVLALLVYLLIRFRIRFSYILLTALGGGIALMISWTAFQHNLERNRSEHATDNLDERVESMANITTDASNLERLNRWNCAIRLWQERPLMGWGPGTYAMVYAPYQLSSELTIISTSAGNRGNAHSEYLGPLAEQGIPGLLLILSLVASVFYTSIRLYIRMQQSELRTTVLLLTLSLVTYFAHGVLNNYLDTDKASVPVFGFMAIIVALDLKNKKESTAV